jgi:hypothetical protein
MYEVVSKIFRTGIAKYTAVAVARSTGPKSPNCEFRVLLRSFTATAWKRAKTSPRTLARTDLAALPWQRPVSHLRPHPAVSGVMKLAVISHQPYSPDLTPCDIFLFPKMKLKLKERRFDTIEKIEAESQRVLVNVTENYFQEAFQKWSRRWDRCLHAGGWRRPISFMVSFMNFTASVRNILDRIVYLCLFGFVFGFKNSKPERQDLETRNNNLLSVGSWKLEI